uniref:Zinc finger protein 277 n=1 Tax=Poecilia latipinna TaxID=48699 RepID=A0A3B3TM60_9TELE
MHVSKPSFRFVLNDYPSGRDSILEPLSFPELGHPSDELLVCLFCSESVPLLQKDTLLRHLLLEHKLIIADIKLIAIHFVRYLVYWKGRFLEQPVTDFCSVIKTNSTGPVEKQEDYFLLCDVLPEDRILRERLQQKRLEEVLEQQQKERDDCYFHRLCLFCSEECTGNRACLLNHMAREHSFSIGLPDNIQLGFSDKTLHSLELSLIYPRHCAEDRQFVHFLLFVQLHNFPPQQVSTHRTHSIFLRNVTYFHLFE